MQINNIVVNDGKSTPVSHTFAPMQAGSVSTWRENVVDIPLDAQTLLRVRRTREKSLRRVRMSLMQYALEETGVANADGYKAAPKIAYNETVNVEFISHSRSTAARITDLRVLALGILANSQIVDLIDNDNTPF